MEKLRPLVFVVGLVACGGNNPATPDAMVDAKPADAKVFLDAPPPMFNFSCYQQTPPMVAADPVTVSGTTGSLGTGGLAALGSVTVDFFKTGTGTALATVVSDPTTGAFASGNLATAAQPLDAYVRGTLATYRTSYLYPPNKVVAPLANVPVPMISTSTFTLLALGAGVSQDDNNNGVLIVAVTDCVLMPLPGATLSVKQGATDVGTQYDLGQLSAAGAGTFAVMNVPDGATTISATYNGMSFPPHIVVAHKKVSGTGTITASAVQPGP